MGPAGFFVALIVLAAAGCDGDAASSDSATPAAPPVPVAPATPPEGISVSELRDRLGANDNAQFVREGGVITQLELHDSGVTDLAPLEGLPLVALGISGLPVDDLTPLAGMPLELLTAENTPVSDVSALRGLPLRELYLRETKIRSLEPLRELPLEKLNVVGTPIDEIAAVSGMPLDTLWIASTNVSDLAPLAGHSLVSLDVENTPVDDLTALSTMKHLRRLNIAGAAVTDLSPLEALSLERLIFTPSKIQRGLEIVRNMPSLQTLGTDFDGQMPASEFWTAYDAGTLESAADISAK